MKYLIIILNLCMAAWMYFFSPAIHMADVTHIRSQIHELELNRVIETNALHVFVKAKTTFSPDQPEFALARYLHHWRGTHQMFTLPASVVFLATAIFLAIFWKPTTKTETSSNQASHATSEPAPGAASSARAG